MFDYTRKNMETSLSAYRKVQLDSFVYVLSKYRKPLYTELVLIKTVHRWKSHLWKVSYQISSCLPGKRNLKEFQHFLEHNYTERFTFLIAREFTQAVWVISDWMLSTKLAGHFPSFHVFFFLRLFLCCFFLQVVQIASNSHRKHVLRAYM